MTSAGDGTTVKSCSFRIGTLRWSGRKNPLLSKIGHGKHKSSYCHCPGTVVGYQTTSKFLIIPDGANFQKLEDIWDSSSQV